MVGIFAGVYGNIAKYREGMLMGVHIPKSELEHPDVKELLQLYKKRKAFCSGCRRYRTGCNRHCRKDCRRIHHRSCCDS